MKKDIYDVMNKKNVCTFLQHENRVNSRTAIGFTKFWPIIHFGILNNLPYSKQLGALRHINHLSLLQCCMQEKRFQKEAKHHLWSTQLPIPTASTWK